MFVRRGPGQGVDAKVNVADGHSYIIVAGTTKAGTGSLFRYLGDHPQVCPSNVKETRFFFDSQDYELPASATVKEGLKAYGRYFTGCRGETFRLEATPDYLYGPRTAGWIRKVLPQAKLIFLLRDPVGRLVSWFRFAKQQGQLPAELSFEQFVKKQLAGSAREESWSTGQIMRTLEHGRYSRYLRSFYVAFPPGSLHVIRFEDFAADTRSAVVQLVNFLGLDETFYQDYPFRRHHRTRTMRSPGLNRAYVALRTAVRMRTHHLPAVKRSLAWLRQVFERVYLPLNTVPDERVVLDNQLRATLREYYQGEEEQLAELVGRPWPRWAQQPTK